MLDIVKKLAISIDRYRDLEAQARWRHRICTERPHKTCLHYRLSSTLSPPLSIQCFLGDDASWSSLLFPPTTHTPSSILSSWASGPSRRMGTRVQVQIHGFHWRSAEEPIFLWPHFYFYIWLNCALQYSTNLVNSTQPPRIIRVCCSCRSFS